MSLNLDNLVLRVTVEPWTLCLIAFPIPPASDGDDDASEPVEAMSKKIASIEETTRKKQRSAAGHDNGSFFSVTRTGHEISILTEEEDETSSSICAEAKKLGVKLFDDPPTRWRALRIVGPLELSMVGVLHEFTRPLTEAGISIYVSSTYLTDYILVKEEHVDNAVAALKSAGWRF